MNDMTRISSRWTFFAKRVFPAIWFGFLFFAVCWGIYKGREDIPPIPALIFMIFVVLFMVVLGYKVMKELLFTLMDEVWDTGTDLIAKNNGKEARIALKDIVAVHYTAFSGPARIILFLRHPSEFGTEIPFMPPMRLSIFLTPHIAAELKARIDASRNGSMA